MIIATTTDRGTDEDSESAGRVTRAMADNFIRRPSVDERAVHMLATMANNDLSMIGREDRDGVLCDAAFVLMDRNKVRFLISGSSAAYHFANGELAHRSLPEDADVIGSGPRYRPRMEEVFELKQEENAFLTASAGLARRVSDEAIAEALRASATPEEWMDHLKALAGEDTQFCAITVLLPIAKPSRLKSFLMRR